VPLFDQKHDFERLMGYYLWHNLIHSNDPQGG
jgi:hypothetical protein